MSELVAFMGGTLFAGYCVGVVVAWREGGPLPSRVAWTLAWPVLMLPNVVRYHRRKHVQRDERGMG